MDRESVAVLAQEIKRKADRETPIPLFRPGTVKTGGPHGMVVADGDQTAVPFLALCEPPLVGDRVMVLFDPPHGCYVIAHVIQPRDLYTARWGPAPAPSFEAGANNHQVFDDYVTWDPAGMHQTGSAYKEIQRGGRYQLYMRGRPSSSFTWFRYVITVYDEDLNMVEFFGQGSDMDGSIGHYDSVVDPEVPLHEGWSVTFGGNCDGGTFTAPATAFGIAWRGPLVGGDEIV